MREALDVAEPLRDAPMVTNVRHEALLRDARESLARAIENLEQAGRRSRRFARGQAPRRALGTGESASEELVLADLADARRAFEEVTGKRTKQRAHCAAVRIILSTVLLTLCGDDVDTAMIDFDVLVIGAGHAGVEAAWAAAEMGCRVGICTLSKDTVAQMPCNPAIGGTAKGHLVREIDALGGLMGLAIDATGIQFKLLNRSRGPAVWSPRAQADKRRYGAWVRAKLDGHPRIEWVVGKVRA